MGITIQEFTVAMETFGAERLPNRGGSRYPSMLVPCFRVGDVEFLHSGSYYVVQRGNKVSGDVIKEAMSKFGEEHPGGDNFWWGEIHSVKGILTLASMIKNTYSKELIDKLTNDTYKKLLKCSLIRVKEKSPFNPLHSPKMEEMHNLLLQYDDLLNPFSNCNLVLKDPIEYLDKVKIGLAFNDENLKLSLVTTVSSAEFHNNSKGYGYYFNGFNDENKGYTSMGHYSNIEQEEEVIYLTYKTNNEYGKQPGDIDLRISMKTGLAWETYHEEEAAPATDEQIEIMTSHLKVNIDKIKRTISNHMIKK